MKKNLQWIVVNWHSQNSLRYNLMFFVEITMFLSVCTLGLCTSNAVKLMLLHYVSLMWLPWWQLLCTSIQYMLIFKSDCDGLWFIMWLSHQHLLLCITKRYKTEFNTSIGWYINLISVHEITFKVHVKNVATVFLQ